MFSSEADIARIARGVIDRTLPKAEWTHAAHFAAAVWVLRHGDPDAMGDLIRRYNEATGTANTDCSGYHETITHASLRGAKSVLDGFPEGTSLDVVANALLASPLGRSDWLLRHWSREVLFSAEARRGWIEPDLMPLPYPELIKLGAPK